MYTREKFSRSFCIPIHVRQAVTYPSESVRRHSNNFHPSRSFASCSSSFQLVQPTDLFAQPWSFSSMRKPVINALLKNAVFCCRSVPVYFVWLKYISWFMYGFEALIINQWKDYGPICMYYFFSVRMSVIHVTVLIKKLYFAKCAYAIRFVIPWTASGFQCLLQLVRPLSPGLAHTTSVSLIKIDGWASNTRSFC